MEGYDRARDEDNVLKRVHYFTGKMLTVDDLRTEQEYLRDLRRRHNRCFHGWGVVCGLDVSADRGTITITAGMAVDCRGDEIELAAPASLVLPVSAAKVLHVLIEPDEKLVDPVPVGEGIEYSRVLELSRIVLTPDDPASAHSGKRRHPCGLAHGVPLARVKWARKRWRVDDRYRRPRTR